MLAVRREFEPQDFATGSDLRIESSSVCDSSLRGLPLQTSLNELL